MARVALASTPNGTLWGERGDASVVLLVGATAQVYQHGTTTPVPVYTAETGSTQLTQPLTVNASGQLPGWCDAPQKVDIVYTNHGVTAPAAETDLIPGEVAYDASGAAATEMGRALAAEALLVGGFPADPYGRARGVLAPSLRDFLSLKDAIFGCAGNGVALKDGSISSTSSTTTFTSATATFTSADVGKRIAIIGADASNGVLATTIAGFTSTHVVTLSAAATATVTGARFTYGTDDFAGIQAAVNAASARGGAVYVPESAGGYYITPSGVGGNGISMPSNVTIWGSGPGSYFVADAGLTTGANKKVFLALGSLSTTTTLTADAVEGGYTAAVTDTTGFAVDQIVQPSMLGTAGTTDRFCSADNPRGEYNRIQSVSTSSGAGTIQFYYPLADTYVAAKGGQVALLNAKQNISLRHFRIVGPSSTAGDVTGFSIEFGYRFTAIEVITERCSSTGIEIESTQSFTVDNCHFRDSYEAGNGYGVSTLWCSQDGTISNCTCERMRHGVILAGGGTSLRGVCRRISAVNNTCQTTDAGIDAHPGGEDISIVGNTVLASADDTAGTKHEGIIVQTACSTIIGNVVRSGAANTWTGSYYGIKYEHLTNRPGQVTITGNSVRDFQGGILVYGVAGFSTWSGVVVADNTVDNVTTLHGILVDGSGQQIFNVALTGNTVNNISASSGIYVKTCSTVSLVGNVVVNAPQGQSAILLSGVNDFSVIGGVITGVSTTSLRGVNMSNCSGGIVAGVRAKTFSYGYQTDSTCSDIKIGVCQFLGCAAFGNPIAGGTNIVVVPQPSSATTPSVASAATLTIPPSPSDLYKITGTTGITSITAGMPGQRIVLLFSAALTVTNGSNLVLNGNFTAANNSTLTLESDGTNWYELSRSPLSGSTTRQQALLTARGWITECLPKNACSASVAPTAGRIYAATVYLFAGEVITNLGVAVTTAGAGAAPTLLKMGLQDSTGNIVAQTANLNGSSWAAGEHAYPLSASYTVPTSGYYRILFLQSGAWGTTQHAMLNASGSGLTGAYTPLSGAPTTFDVGAAAGESYTDLPANGSALSLAGGGTNARAYYMAAG